MKKPLKFRKILFIDDDVIINILHKRIAEKLNVCDEIEVLTSGVKGLGYLAETLNEGNQLPDVVFLDIRMPLMSGFEMLDAWKQLPEYRPSILKVIILTSSLEDEDRILAKKYSEVIDFVNKPLTVELFRSLLEHVSEVRTIR